MPDHTISPAHLDQFVATMTEGMTTLARTLASWTTAEDRTLGDLEPQVMRATKELGATLLAGLAQLLVPDVPPPTTICSCGEHVPYQRMRSATIKTLLGPLQLTRPYITVAAVTTVSRRSISSWTCVLVASVLA